MGVDAKGANVLSGGGPASLGAAQSAQPGERSIATSASGDTDQPANTSQVADAVREAAESRLPIRITAGCGWLEAGRPTDPDARQLDLRALRGIVEYNPGDLTLTARAATTLAEIDDATRAHRQWLPLDPLGAEGDTIGATLATASCGPLASSLGLPRDLALGLEFVDGRGTILRAGGKVVKNVAGFDLVRLTVGAWGTLGVITEVTVRLRARPEGAVTVALDLPSDITSLATLLRTLRTLPLTPIAGELLSAPLAARAGAGDRDVVLLRLAGNAISLAAQRAQLASLGNDRDLPESVWEALRRAFTPAGASFRLSQRPSRLAELWMELRATSRDFEGSLCHASLERGVARCVEPMSEPDALRIRLGELAQRWSLVGEQLPATVWSALAPTGDDRLSRGVRAAFDPHAVLNRGIFISGS